MEFAVGGADMAPYLPLLEEELAFRGEDRRAPGWRKADVAPDVDFRVVIIGAGMSGLLAAHRLRQAGVAFVILEKNDDVGGTWLENSYPGCRVDNPNHNYSYSFAQRHDWPLHFSTQDVLLDYFRRCADAFGLRDLIRFGTDGAVGDVVRAGAALEGRGAASRRPRRDHRGQRRRQRGRAAQPPALPRHRGPRFVRGPERSTPPVGTTTIDLPGKRVAVIGTGASAVQFIPEIAPGVGELLVFQRTPPWLGPTDDYHAAVEPGLRWLYAHVPSYSEWNRFRIFWKMGDGVLAGVTRSIPTGNRRTTRSASSTTSCASC